MFLTSKLKEESKRFFFSNFLRRSNGKGTLSDLVNLILNPKDEGFPLI